VWIVALPMIDSGLQAAGFDSNVAARQAFCSVESLEAAWRDRQVDLVDVRLPQPAR